MFFHNRILLSMLIPEREMLAVYFVVALLISLLNHIILYFSNSSGHRTDNHANNLSFGKRFILL